LAVTNSNFTTFIKHKSETQQHLLVCQPILDKISSRQGASTIVYEDIFDSEKQLAAVSWFSELFDVREVLMASQS
jgi:hypothetical protein